ncbi:cell division protein ZipA [Lysobacter daejeonensis GH1-9]|uniref:Cell division protein ZipA n=1 Tax=Lysobacter daejeonensis GH1-9 TaxID=1385517 RepID=A0A0A0F0K8_9GAMM|nr:cell division protein ZipA [Lysobacter daejeonensis]KGM54942.1 cell division protein ZipA [Lysobacter daejeonensis GH1-9]
MSDMTLLRVGILVAGLILIAAIFWFGRPRKPGQGKRLPRNAAPKDADSGRLEPTLGEQIEAALADGGTRGGEATTQAELDLFERTLEGSTGVPTTELGKRSSEDFDKIVTVYLAARAGNVLNGSDIVVAAEKAGLVYGYLGVFHRLVERRPEQGPVFSMANIKTPGSFDMSAIQSLETPAVAFFLTLPAPVPALEAWDTMLPTVQRMAELLDGVVLDDQRNALGRQRIAHIRDELRAYDRQREAPPLTKPGRW